jgi:hypothetical protein
VDPGIWIFLGIIAEHHRRWTGAELVVTSLRRPPGGRSSRHSTKEHEPVSAADFRRHALDERHAADPFCLWLQIFFGEELGVVLEPEWLTPEEISERGGVLNIDPHVHVQLKTSDYPRV